MTPTLFFSRIFFSMASKALNEQHGKIQKKKKQIFVKKFSFLSFAPWSLTTKQRWKENTVGVRAQIAVLNVSF